PRALHWGIVPVPQLCAHCTWGHPGPAAAASVPFCHQYLPPTATDTTARVAALRDAMWALGVQAYVVPATDAHMSEYISARDARLSWLTGFTGSAGTGVVTQDKAALWTDSRYWTQAERQLDCNWELQRTTLIESIGMWILDAVPIGGNVSLDPFLFSIGRGLRGLVPTRALQPPW
uniref:Creatinase N-terminal domain-containing protein n=1 Tax=Strigops habroptila TaxID=2489341 RepID=A0A672US56_STRHB